MSCGEPVNGQECYNSGFSDGAARVAYKIAESAPSASSNSDYAAASRIYKEFLVDSLPFHHEDKFIAWCEQRLNSAKAPNCA